MDAKLRLDHSLVALETEGGVYGLLELRAPEPEPDATRPKLAIALVIDRSGSMAHEKLEVAKSCAGYLAGRITAEDQLAVVSYDDHVSLTAALQGPGPGLGFAIDQLFREVAQTSLEVGSEGVEVLEENSADVRRVLLLTDGLANVGIRDRDQLASMSASAAGRGITTTTIGFGDDFDEQLLSAMADSGRGKDHFAASPDEAPSIFAEEFDRLAAMVAQNLSVEVRPVGHTTDVGIVNDYPLTSTGTGLQAAFGDVYGGQAHKLVFRIQTPAMAELGQIKVADVVIRWSDVTGESVTMHTRTIPVFINVATEAEASDELPDSGVTEHIVILDAAKARKDAHRLFADGDPDGAQRLLSDQIERLRLIPPTSPEFGPASDDIEQLEGFTKRLKEKTFDKLSAKEIWFESQRRNRNEEYPKRPNRS